MKPCHPRALRRAPRFAHTASERGEVSDLRFECASDAGRGIDDRFAEFENAAVLALQLRWKARDIGIETHAEQRIMALGRGGKLVGEIHGWVA